MKILTRTILAILCLPCVGFDLGGSVNGVSSKTVLIDNEPYTSGPYLAYLGPWGKGSYVEGKDYTETFIVTPASFPRNSTIIWDWPNTPPAKTGVYNFLALDYGNYDNTRVRTPIGPKQVNTIVALNESHNFKLSGMLTGYDVIDDMFLTSSAGDQTKQLFEIEVSLHTPHYSTAYAKSVKQLGYFRGSGKTWIVSIDTSRSAADILFLPSDHADVPVGKVDMKAMLDFLVSKHILTGNEWFNGFGIGVEVRQGKGTAVFNSFSASYK